MADLITFTDTEIEQKPMAQFAEEAYLNYAMYVILDRALPHIGDGLKPVQRRIIYAMSELGLNASAKYKKSARTVGDVLGKFHPHGDSACYEAMVLMAQSFSYRYPLLDGQGNWGSPDDPKSFAAMRYTESRLSPYANLLLSELGQGTVEWTDNFDGSLQEPLTLPARVPNILLNGVTGIAVGMATDVPPHNLTEVVSACLHLLDQPNASLEALCMHIQGPDYPTDAEIITPKADLLALYRCGRGSIRMRAVFQIENGEIVITALPHQVSGAKILEQIASQLRNRKLPMVVDLRDESDHENPTRLVVVPKSNRVDLNALTNHLFASTDLERTYRVNINLIGLNGKPQVKGLQTLLTEWLQYRLATVTKRLSHRLAKVEKRLHLLEGLLIAFLNIDEVIAIIRNNDRPKPVLMERFALSDLQAESVLELRLRQLAKLEEMKIRGEQDELNKERGKLLQILGSKARLKQLIAKELKADAKQFADPRRSPIVQRKEARALQEADLVSSEPVTVVLSAKGWVRCAKGHEVDVMGLNYRSGDHFSTAAKGRSTQNALFLDSTGRAYSLPAHTLPSARGQGEPLSGRLASPAGASFEQVLMGEPEEKYLIASDAGYGFIVPLSELQSKNKAGKALVTLPAGAKPLTPLKIVGEVPSLAVATNLGRLLIFPIADLPELNRGKGNKMISIQSAKLKARLEYVAAISLVLDNTPLIIQSGKRHLTLKGQDIDNYRGGRGLRGKKLPRGFQKVDALTTE